MSENGELPEKSDDPVIVGGRVEIRTIRNPSMRRPALRFSVRKMMIAVLVASLVLGVVAEVIRLRRLSEEYRGRASLHAREMKQFKLASRQTFRVRDRIKKGGISDPRDYLGLGPRIPASYQAIYSLYERELKYQFRSQWHQKMREKWDRAAERPWLTIEPDPAEPE